MNVRIILVFIMLFMSLLLHGQTVDDYNKAGYKAEQDKNFREALNQYSKVHAVEPDNASINRRIGLMYYNLDKLDSAIIFYSKAIGKTSNDSVSYYQRGHCYLDKLDFEKSLKDFEHAFNITQRRNGHAAFNIGKSYAGLNNIPKAIEFYKLTLQIEPQDKYSFYELGYCYALQSKSNSALKYYNKAIEKDNRYYHAYLNRGLLYAAQLKNQTAAHKDLETSIEIRPKNQQSYVYNAMLYNEDEEFGKAKDLLNKVIELYPNYAEAYFQRAVTWYKIGILNEVCRDLDKAIKLGHMKAEEMKKLVCK